MILNNEYLKIVSFSKLTLNTFFLGFSFPLSLITMSIMFSFIKGGFGKLFHLSKDSGFWAINLGVIIFFVFIMFEKLVLQLVVTLILFVAVIMIYYLFSRFASVNQQKYFLASGMGFLLFTSVTGILYIILEFFPEYGPEYIWDKAKFPSTNPLLCGPIWMESERSCGYMQVS